MITSCCKCGREIALKDFDDCDEFELIFRNIVCEECGERQKAERDAANRRMWLDGIDDYLIRCGIPPKMAAIKSPVNRIQCEELWRNRRSNMVIGGAPGAGKTTAVAFVIRQILANDGPVKVRYATMAEIANEWLRAKHDRTEMQYLRGLKSLELLAIDEIRGRRADSEAVNELVFTLIDGAANGGYPALWLIGNIQRLSWDRMFEHDPEAVKRRLNESFVSYVFRDGGAEKIRDKW